MKALLFIAFFAFSLNQIHGLQDNEACLACRKWSNFMWNMTNNADEKLYDSLSKLCSDYSDLPGLQTKTFCNQSLHNFFSFLKERFNKDKFCYDVKACVDGNDDGIRDISTFVNDATDCKFCIYVNTKIKELISGRPTEIEIQHHFEDACHYMGSFENECLNLVDQYINTVFKFIKEKFIPEDCCKSMRICPKLTGPLENEPIMPSTNEIVNLLPVNMTLANDFLVQNLTDPTCDICKKIVRIIQRQLQDNATDEQIVNVLMEVCELFPSNKRDNCKKVVKDYADRLIQILSQDIDSDTACLLAGLCANQALRDYLDGNYLNRFRLRKGNALCVECEMIAHFIQNEMYNYKTEQQIEEWIKNHLCNKMAFVIQPANCQAFIDQYGPIILQTIAQDVFNPDMLCYQELKLCKKNSMAKIHVIPKEPESIENVKCQMCQDIIKNISKVNDQSELEIDNIIQQSCQQMPSEHQVECALMVKSFAPFFLDMLDRYDNPLKICESIDICLTPGKVHLLGGYKCTYGPSYWCHSVSHANACQAFKYCHQKVWKPIQP